MARGEKEEGDGKVRPANLIFLQNDHLQDSMIPYKSSDQKFGLVRVSTLVRIYPDCFSPVRGPYFLDLKLKATMIFDLYEHKYM